MTSATARAKAKAPKAEKRAIALVDKQEGKGSPHEFYAKQPPMTAHCIEMTEGVLLASTGEYRKLTKKERALIAEAAELRLVPSATIMLANVLCAQSGKSARETVSELIHAEVGEPNKDVESGSNRVKGEDEAFEALSSLVRDTYEKFGIVEALQAGYFAMQLADQISTDMSKNGEDDVEKHKEVCVEQLVQWAKQTRVENGLKRQKR